MSTPASSTIGRVTLDLDQLVSQGALSLTEAQRLKSVALPAQANRIIANVLLIFGAFMLVAGVLILRPPLDVGLGLAIGALAIGGTLVYKARDEWGLLGQTLVLMGIVGLGGWSALRFDELGEPWPHLVAPFVAFITIIGAIASRNRVLAALAPIAVGGVIGAGTSYWDATYSLYISEATVCILLFGTLAAGLLWLRPRLRSGLQDVALVGGRVSFILANFGFWVGSLWGDYPGEMWLSARKYIWSYDQAWRATALYIPDYAFALAWPACLGLALYLGLKSHRRFVANTAIVFLAIHLYTQFFERFYQQGGALVVGGIGLIAFGFALVRFDRWQTGRMAQARSERP